MTAHAEESRCDRVRAWAALAPDGELSQLEQRLLRAHLDHCPPCRLFATEVAAIALELRGASPHAPPVLDPPPAPVRPSAHARLRAAGAVAAVATMAVGIAARAPLGPPHDPGEARLRTPALPVDAAELQTIRQLRREALLTSRISPDRPARAFGNQPA